MSQPRPATHPVTCPTCGADLFRDSEGETTIRARVLVLRAGDVVAKCPKGKCRGEAVVPFLQVQDTPPARRFVVRSGLTGRNPGS
jgi:hypothetical protein